MIDAVMHRRRINSFVRRQGRITTAQRRALQTVWPRYGITVSDDETVLDFNAAFNRRAPLYCEVGFGAGETLTALAARYPSINWLGIDVYSAGIGAVLQRLAAQGLDNVRLLCGDASTLLARCVRHSVSGVLVFFPDPWPKARHHKRRLLTQQSFLDTIASVLCHNGILHCATDCDDYGNDILAMLEAHPYFVNANNGFARRSPFRLTSRFARRADAKQTPILELHYQCRHDHAIL